MTPDRRAVGRTGTRPVRLTDVPIAIRRRRGRALVEQTRLSALGADGPLAAAALIEAAQLELAIEQPSSRVYWLPEEAVTRVLGPG